MSNPYISNAFTCRGAPACISTTQAFTHVILHPRSNTCADVPGWGWSPLHCIELQVPSHVCLSIAALCPGPVILRGATVCATTFWMHRPYGLWMASGNLAIADQSAHCLPVWLSLSGECLYCHGAELHWCMGQAQIGQSLPAILHWFGSVRTDQDPLIATCMLSRYKSMSSQQSTTWRNTSICRLCAGTNNVTMPVALLFSPCTRRLPMGEKT